MVKLLRCESSTEITFALTSSVSCCQYGNISLVCIRQYKQGSQKFDTNTEMLMLLCAARCGVRQKIMGDLHRNKKCFYLGKDKGNFHPMACHEGISWRFSWFSSCFKPNRSTVAS
jgi:hypothetical protein